MLSNLIILYFFLQKTPVCEERFLCNNLSSVYATVDKSKKIRNRQGCNKDNIINKTETNSTSYEPCSQTNKDLLCSVGRQTTTKSEQAKTNSASMINNCQSSNSPQGLDNYMNSVFLQSLEFYENSKDLRDNSFKKENSIGSVDRILKPSITNKAPPMVHSVCKKCSHESKLPFPTQLKQDDYLMMEPSSSEGNQELTDMQTNCHLGSCTKHHVPGYLPMHPVGGPVSMNTQDFLKMRLCQQLKSMNDRAASSPSLTDHNLEKLRKACDLETHRNSQGLSGSPVSAISHSISAANSPYLRRRVLCCVNELAKNETNNPVSRKIYLPNPNTSSLDFDISLGKPEKVYSSENNFIVNQNLKTKYSEIAKQATVNNHTYMKTRPKDSCDVLAGHERLGSEGKGEYENIDWEKFNLNEPTVHIRSSSVPSKSSHNRDSSSSNDSGVSSCSMKGQTNLDKPDLLLVSSRRYTYSRDEKNSRIECFHSSLPRRSKSVDPLQDIAFQFQKVEVPMKSSSAEAEVPVCHSKQEAKGIQNIITLLRL